MAYSSSGISASTDMMSLAKLCLLGLSLFSVFCSALLYPLPSSPLRSLSSLSHAPSSPLRCTRLSAVSQDPSSSSKLIFHYEDLEISTFKGIHLTDITPYIRDIVNRLDIKSGQVVLLSKHTTTSIVINEMESRLVDDIRQYLLKLAPPDYPYLHNDLHLRSGPKGVHGLLNDLMI
jgi:hypothetical protein